MVLVKTETNIFLPQVPVKGLSYSAKGMGRLLKLPALKKNLRRVQSAEVEGRKKFQTEDGKWVFQDNYSFE